MKKSAVFFTLSLFLLAACEPDRNESSSGYSISVKGSDTVLPLTQRVAEEFMLRNSESAITIVGGGSGTGITALLDGTTDIGMLSRELKLSEKIRFAEKQITVKNVAIGYDALMIVVNPGNTVDRLTREQLEKIFTGEITNWKEVGGADARIVAYCRESSSGTYEFFKDHVLDKKNYASSVLNMPATGAIVQSVSQTKGAIGYVGLAYETGSVKPVKVSYDQGKTFVAPSVAGAKDKSYPIARPLFYLYNEKNEARVNGFIDFVLSDEGQKLVADIGYVPVR